MTALNEHRHFGSIPRKLARHTAKLYNNVVLGDTNIEVTSVSWYTATFSWSNNVSSTSYYELHCGPINSTFGYNRTVIIDKDCTAYTFWDLKPSVSYQAWIMSHFYEDHDITRSNKIQFQTEPVPEDIFHTMVLGQIVDLILIVCLLGCWAFACFLFYKEWSAFHLQLPNRYTPYKNSPKGLENIKVIKRAQDSVIYRNPNQSMSLKISERNRKLARMHTAPSSLVKPEENEVKLSIKRSDFKRRTTNVT
ncbi:uncharacterized protein [Watersipora subatra]|uniref:uncharacterized protein n=1 Tax=Watersipora subatra TaxID=2589382 RepID=UPI00355B7369